MPNQTALSSSRGQSVGGVSGRAGAKAGESNLSAYDSFACVAVEGILVFWKAAPFAGRRSNEGLGRSVSGVAVPPPHTRAPMTADVRRSPRRGTPSACATKCMHPSRAREIVASEQGTRPSLGPSTRARQSSLCFEGQLSKVGRKRRHHGWASSRKGEEPSLGSARTDGARLAADHRFRKGEGVIRKKRKEVEASVPARVMRVRVWLPARRSAVAEVSRRRLVSNKLGKRAPKRAARVE